MYRFIFYLLFSHPNRCQCFVLFAAFLCLAYSSSSRVRSHSASVVGGANPGEPRDGLFTEQIFAPQFFHVCSGGPLGCCALQLLVLLYCTCEIDTRQCECSVGVRTIGSSALKGSGPQSWSCAEGLALLLALRYVTTSTCSTTARSDLSPKMRALCLAPCVRRARVYTRSSPRAGIVAEKNVGDPTGVEPVVCCVIAGWFQLCT